jgi:hypothetical protein
VTKALKTVPRHQQILYVFCGGGVRRNVRCRAGIAPGTCTCPNPERSFPLLMGDGRCFNKLITTAVFNSDLLFLPSILDTNR